MKRLINCLTVCALSVAVVTCSKSESEPTPDLTSIDAFNALVFADYHSVVDTISTDALRLLYEAQATFTQPLDEYEGDPVMETMYTVVELRYGKDQTEIVSNKIIHDCATGERTVITKDIAWMEDAAMAVVPPISLRDAINTLERNGKMPHTKVVTLREDILWKMHGEFDFPQYIFGTTLFVDSMTGVITE